MEDLQGSSIPENMEKIQQEVGGEIRGPILGFQITDNTCDIFFNGEDARR